MIKYQEISYGEHLKKKRIPTKYVTLIKDMYTNIMTSVRTYNGESNAFLIKIGLHQRSALSPYIFTLVMDKVTNDIQRDIFWCILFANNVMLIDESRIKVDQKLELWRHTLKLKYFRLSRTKTEYMRCQFNANNTNDEDISLDEQVVSMKDTFQYFKTML
jgi:Reverse transcriptase (RNA-dependent DNA polymerase)